MNIYVSFIAVTLFHFTFFRSSRISNPIHIFFIAFLYYTYFVPINMLIYQQFDLKLLDQQMWVDKGMIDNMAIIFILSYIGFSLGYRAIWSFSNHDRNRVIEDSIWNVVKMSPSALSLSVAGIASILLIFTVFLPEFILLISSYEDKIAVNYQSSIFAFLFAFFQVTLALVSCFLVMRSRRYYLATIVGVLLFVMLALATFSKGPFIYILVLSFAFLYRWSRLKIWASLGIVASAAIFALFFLVPIFASFRATGRIEFFSQDQISMATIYSDAIGPFNIIVYSLQNYLHAEAHPLWESFVLWVPRFVWEARPLDFPEAFARIVIKNWQPGFGLGFSPVAEAFSRYGYLGTLPFMALCGATLAAFQVGFARFLDPLMREPAILVVGGYVSILFMRGSFSGIFTANMQIWLPIVGISIIGSWMRKSVSTTQLAGLQKSRL